MSEKIWQRIQKKSIPKGVYRRQTKKETNEKIPKKLIQQCFAKNKREL